MLPRLTSLIPVMGKLRRKNCLLLFDNNPVTTGLESRNLAPSEITNEPTFLSKSISAWLLNCDSKET